MLIESLPIEADAKTWQVIARQQHHIAQKQQAIVQTKEAQLLHQTEQIVSLETLIAQLKEQIAQLKRLQFGKKSEAFTHEQQDKLIEDLTEDIAATNSELKALLPNNKNEVKSQPKRQPLSDALPREAVHHQAPSMCPDCGGELCFIRNEVSERLDFIPARYVVREHIRPLSSCRQCEKMVSTRMPAQIIDKGIPETGLLAHVAISKYVDHLPLYRQIKIFARSGVILSMSTLTDWMGTVGVALQPLVQAMRADLLKQNVLHADETTLQVLDPGRGQTKKAYVWLYQSNMTAMPQIAVYDLQDSREGKHARHFLQGYQGGLMVDDYSGYKALFAEPFLLTELGCWAHARRKFLDIFAANKNAHAKTVLEMMQCLYAIERHAANLSVEARQQYRQKEAKPIIEQLHIWLLDKQKQTWPSAGLAKAINYTLKRWPALIRYLDNGHYPIDNNKAENSMRPIALGRKNGLFVGSLAAGRRAANMMSLVETAKLNGHDPFEYLKNVLTRLPTQPNRLLHELLPYHWKPDSA